MNNKDILILVVDDLQGQAIEISHILESKGYKALAAFSGTECLSIIKKHQVDLVLIDIVMPDKNGIDVCHRLKAMEISTEIPVIICSAFADRETIRQGFWAGAVDYCVKSIKNNEILAILNTHIGFIKLQKRLSELLLENKLLKQQLKEIKKMV